MESRSHLVLPILHLRFGLRLRRHPTPAAPVANTALPMLPLPLPFLQLLYNPMLLLHPLTVGPVIPKSCNAGYCGSGGSGVRPWGPPWLGSHYPGSASTHGITGRRHRRLMPPACHILASGRRLRQVQTAYRTSVLRKTGV